MGLNPQKPTPVGRVAGFVLRNPSHPTRLTKTQRLKITQIRRRSGAPQLRSGHVWPSFTQIYSNPAKVYSLPHSYMLKSGDIWLDLAKIYSNSAKTPVSPTLTPLILGDLGQISIDSKEYWPNLVRFGQISAKLRQYQKTQNRPIHTRKPIQPDPVDLKFHLGWLRVEIFPTR